MTFDSYDDTDYGYVRIIATETQLRVEYHPASDGSSAKTPDDHVTVDLKNRTLGHFVVNDLGRPAAADAVRRVGASPTPTSAGRLSPRESQGFRCDDQGRTVRARWSSAPEHHKRLPGFFRHFLHRRNWN